MRITIRREPHQIVYLAGIDNRVSCCYVLLMRMIDGMWTMVVQPIAGSNHHIVVGKTGDAYVAIKHKTLQLAHKFASDLNKAPGSCGKWVVLGYNLSWVVGVQTSGEPPEKLTRVVRS